MQSLEGYLQGYGATEQARLRHQPGELELDTRWLLDQLGIQTGWKAVEIGCGPSGILDLLADLVGATGSVVGVEKNRALVGLAREFVAERGLTNVEVAQGDGRATGYQPDTFDLAYERLVLTNVPSAEEIVAEMVSLVRDGGVVALHEVGMNGFIEPPTAAWRRLEELYGAYAQGNNIDPFVGRRVPAMLRGMGMTDVHVRPIVAAYPPGHSRRGVYPQLVENLRAGLVSEGLVTDRELDELLSDVRAALGDPDTLVISAVHLQIWGRKPL